jgi:transposase
MLPEPGETPARRDSPRVRPDAIVYAEGAAGALDADALRQERVQRRAHLARGRSPISSTENFWSQAKRQLRRYNGVPRQHLRLFLKECEWRYNYGPPKQLLRLLKSWLREQASDGSSRPEGE